MKRLRLSLALATVCALAAACWSGPPDAAERAGRTAAPITNGTPDDGDGAIVGILDGTGGLSCTGSVVAQHVVLTAAHCTTADVATGGSVAFGSSVGAATTIPIALAVTHPGYDPSTFANDVGLLVLPSAAPVAPVSMGDQAPAVGAVLDLVGFGATAGGAGDFGSRHHGTGVVSAVDATTFTVAPDPSQPCTGDSGGPALASGSSGASVAGVSSHGDTACVAGGTYMRVDAFSGSFLGPTLALYAPGSAATGARCLFPEQCAGGASACLTAPDDANVTYCTAPCSVNADCPSGMLCVESGDATECRYPIPTPGAYGAPCATSADCVQAECTTTGVCATRCVPDGDSCPSGFACVNTSDIDFFCLSSGPPQAAGGCATAARADPGGTWWALAVVASLVWWRLARAASSSPRGSCSGSRERSTTRSPKGCSGGGST